MSSRALFDTLRSLAFGGISTTYAAIGSAVTVLPRIICITNDTNKSLIFSDDNTVVAGKLYLPAGSFKLFDITSNMNPKTDDSFYLAIGTVIYVKEVIHPTSGAVYVEYVYGN